jgi:hypothetical protein
MFQSLEENLFVGISELRDEHQDDLTTTGNSDLNNSIESLGPSGLTSDLDLNQNVAPSNRRLSAPNPQTLQLTPNQTTDGDRLRRSYFDRLMVKGFLPNFK